MTLEEQIKNYLSSLRTMRKSENTLVAYDIHITSWYKWITDTKADLNNGWYFKYIDYLREQNYKTNSINLKLMVIRSFIKWLNLNDTKKIIFLEKEVEVPNYTRIAPINKEREEKSCVTGEDLKIMIEEAGKDKDVLSQIILLLLMNTGMRISEASWFLTTPVDQLGINEKTEFYYFKVQGKGNVYRNIFIPKKLMGTMLAYAQENEIYFKERFPGSENLILKRPVDRGIIRNRIKKYGRYVEGKKITPHSFRHGYASYLLNELKMGIVDVKYRLGHASITTTQLYLHEDENKTIENTRVIKMLGEGN